MKKISILSILLSFLLLTNCYPTKSFSRQTMMLSISKTKCGSYAVMNEKDTLGFIVKPFIIDMDTTTKFKIQEFELKVKKKYPHKINKRWRIYFFDIRNKDTVLMTLIISPKRLNKNPEWKCTFDEIQHYPKHSKWIDYNFSKHSFFTEIKTPFFRRKSNIIF